MNWGLEHSAGHYVDLSGAVLGFTLFSIGYSLHAMHTVRTVRAANRHVPSFPLAMASALQITVTDVQRIRRVQTITIAWMIVEAAVSLFAAWRAHSPALFAFGGDSAIELLSAAIVLWRFRTPATQEHSERNVARMVGMLLLALAAYVVAISSVSLVEHREPMPTLLGIAILSAAVIIMPVLTNEKRKLSAVTGSAALRADAVQSGTCAYLSVIALVGLAVNAVWRVVWADPVAALAVVTFVTWEGREAMRGKPCGCS